MCVGVRACLRACVRVRACMCMRYVYIRAYILVYECCHMPTSMCVRACVHRLLLLPILCRAAFYCRIIRLPSFKSNFAGAKLTTSRLNLVSDLKCSPTTGVN